RARLRRPGRELRVGALVRRRVPIRAALPRAARRPAAAVRLTGGTGVWTDGCAAAAGLDGIRTHLLRTRSRGPPARLGDLRAAPARARPADREPGSDPDATAARALAERGRTVVDPPRHGPRSRCPLRRARLDPA